MTMIQAGLNIEDFIYFKALITLISKILKPRDSA